MSSLARSWDVRGGVSISLAYGERHHHGESTKSMADREMIALRLRIFKPSRARHMAACIGADQRRPASELSHFPVPVLFSCHLPGSRKLPPVSKTWKRQM